MKSWLSLWMTLALAAAVRANPFFAMDNTLYNLQALETVKRLGYAGVSWRTGDTQTVATAVAGIQRQGLKLFAVYASPCTLTKTGLVWDAHPEETLKILEGTGAALWLPISSQDFPVRSPAGDAVAVPALQRLADQAARHGLSVAIYPHQGCWAERVQDAVRLAQKVDRKNLGVTFNLCHCLMAGDEAQIPELLTAAAPYLRLVTINGADRDAANTSWERLIRPLDNGTYEVGLVLKQLAARGYTGPIGLQGFGVRLPAGENLTRSMAAWRKLNGEK